MESLNILLAKINGELEIAVNNMAKLDPSSPNWSYWEGRSHMANQALVYILQAQVEIKEETK